MGGDDGRYGLMVSPWERAPRRHRRLFARRATADRTAEHRKSDQPRGGPCAGGLRKRGSLIASVMRHSITKSC
jgi:hypothetical protein